MYIIISKERLVNVTANVTYPKSKSLAIKFDIGSKVHVTSKKLQWRQYLSTDEQTLA